MNDDGSAEEDTSHRRQRLPVRTDRPSPSLAPATCIPMTSAPQASQGADCETSERCKGGMDTKSG